MNHFSLQMAHFPWVFFMPQWFIKDIYNIYVGFFFLCFRIGALGYESKNKSRLDMNHRRPLLLYVDGT